MTPISGPSVCKSRRRFIYLSLVLSALSITFLLVCIFPDPRIAASAGAKPQPEEAALAQNPDAVCSGCHSEIYEKYERTPMARGSGTAVDGLLTGGFLHAASGIRYSVFLRDGKAWMSYDRDADPANSGGRPALHGERQLIYFIGSGHRGRTYLYQDRKSTRLNSSHRR